MTADGSEGLIKTEMIYLMVIISQEFLYWEKNKLTYTFHIILDNLLSSPCTKQLSYRIFPLSIYMHFNLR